MKKSIIPFVIGSIISLNSVASDLNSGVFESKCNFTLTNLVAAVKISDESPANCASEVKSTHISMAVQEAKPDLCPDGYEQYGALQGGVVGSSTLGKFVESRRTCIEVGKGFSGVVSSTEKAFSKAYVVAHDVIAEGYPEWSVSFFSGSNEINIKGSNLTLKECERIKSIAKSDFSVNGSNSCVKGKNEVVFKALIK